MALFGSKEVLEMHLAPFLDKLSVLEQKKTFTGTVPFNFIIFLCAVSRDSLLQLKTYNLEAL